MATILILGMIPLWVISGSASAQSCAQIASCDVNVTDLTDIAEMIEQDVTSWGLVGVNFWIKGVEWGKPENDSDIFDPNWWSWYSKNAGTLMDMPLDYDILSVGTLSMRLSDYEVKFSSSPPGCLSALSTDCQRQIVVETLLNMTNREKNDDDEMICRSVYGQKSALTGNTVGVCKRCCKRKLLLTGVHKCSVKEEYHMRHYDTRRILVFVFGTILPLLSIPLVMAWADFKPLDVGHGFADYASNKLMKYCHFKLRGSSTTQPLDQRTIIIKDKDLLEFEGPILTLASIAQKSIPFKMGKVKFTIFFLLQYIPVSLWLYFYSRKKEVMKYFDSWEKIVFNLRYNPFSWLYTDPQFWPYKFAIFLVTLNVASFICLCIWWLLESTELRKCFMNLIIKSSLYGKFHHGRGKFKTRRTTVPLERMFRDLFIALFVTLMVGTYMVVFSFFHSAIYTIGGIVVNIELLASWLTGAALVIYYVNRSYTGVKAKYTDIKRLVFDECLQVKLYKGSILMTVDVLVNDSEKSQMLDRDQQVFKYEWSKAEGPVVLYDKDRVLIPKMMFLRICNKLEPLGANVKKAFIDLIFTLFFLGLVVFTIAVFRPYDASSEMNVVVTSLVTLLTALIPQLSEMSNCQEQDDLEKSVLAYKVKRSVASYKPTLRTLTSTSVFSPKATMIKRLAREDVDATNPEMMAPLGTAVIGATDSGNLISDDFNPMSSLPTPVQGKDNGLNAGPLSTIASVSPGPPQKANQNGGPSCPRPHRLTSHDSGMMVLDLGDLSMKKPDYDPDDDIAFIDDSITKEHAVPLFTETNV